MHNKDNFKNIHKADISKFISNSSVFIAKNFDKYGDFYQIHIPFVGYDIFAVADPDVVQQLLVRNEQNYNKSKFFWKQLKEVAGLALGTKEGEEWLISKRQHLPHFTHQQSANYLAEIINSNLAFFNQFELSDMPQNIDTITFFSELNTATFLKVLFGYEDALASKMLAQTIAKGQKYIFWRSIYPWRPWLAQLMGKVKQYDKTLKQIDDFTWKIVKNRDATHQTSTRLIDTLLLNTDFNNNSATIQNLRSELVVYLGAGTETVAVALGWTIYLLANNPDKYEILKTEIDNISAGKPINTTQLKDLIYTDFVIKEALRLYSPSHAIVRDAIENDNYNGITIPKNATIIASSYAMHRNPKYWKNPNEFVPERFLEEPEKYTYFPFGIGKHTCIGRYMATPLLIYTVAEFVRRYKFTLNSQEVINPISSSTLKPDQPITVRLQKR